MKFTQIPATAFSELQLNAGILLSNFVPATGTVDAGDIIGATSGGITASIKPTYKDLGEDVDNCPKNTKELKQVDSWEVKMSGTMLTASTATAKSLLGPSDIGTGDNTIKVTPRAAIAAADFDDIWWVGDYSDKNGATNGGFIAIKIANALSTGGFQIKSNDKGKGQFAFEYTGHSSTASPDTIPAEIYIKAGSAEPA